MHFLGAFDSILHVLLNLILPRFRLLKQISALTGPPESERRRTMLYVHDTWSVWVGCLVPLRRGRWTARAVGVFRFRVTSGRPRNWTETACNQALFIIHCYTGNRIDPMDMISSLRCCSVWANQKNLPSMERPGHNTP